MSGNASIKINGRLLVEWKNSYDDWYFHEREFFHENISSTKYEFAGCRVKVKTIRGRLKLAGYDDRSLEQDFNETISGWMKDIDAQIEFYHRLDEPSLDIYRKSAIKNLDSYLSILAGYQLQDWKDRLPKALEMREEYDTDISELLTFDFNKADDPLLSFMLSPIKDLVEESNYGFCFSLFPCKKMESYALLLMDMCSEEDVCELDITDLANSGWISKYDSQQMIKSGETQFYVNFKSSIDEILTLNRSRKKPSSENPVLQRMLFSSLITIMEAYLSDTMKCQVLNRPANKRRFVEHYKVFTDKNIKESRVFDFLDNLDKKLNEEIDKISFHNVELVTGLYKNVLLCDFPKDKMAELTKCISIRHDIVHRNGKSFDGSKIIITKGMVVRLIMLLLEVVKYIDVQIKNSLLEAIPD